MLLRNHFCRSPPITDFQIRPIILITPKRLKIEAFDRIHTLVIGRSLHFCFLFLIFSQTLNQTTCTSYDENDFVPISKTPSIFDAQDNNAIS